MSVARPAGQQTVRRHNLGLVLEQIATGHGRSRAQLAHATGLTRTTVSALVDELVATRLVSELAPDRGSRGRPAAPLVLNPNGPAGLGIEINVDYISACVVDLTGAVRSRRTTITDNRLGTPRAGLQRALRLAEQVRADVDLPVAGVTLALPGLVDDDGVLRRAPNLPRWEGIDAAPVLGEALRLPVGVDNEANLAALAELWFGDGLPDFMLVSGEVGVGAGVVLGGRLFRGTRGLAGELGHVVVDPSGTAVRVRRERLPGADRGPGSVGTQGRTRRRDLDLDGRSERSGRAAGGSRLGRRRPGAAGAVRGRDRARGRARRRGQRPRPARHRARRPLRPARPLGAGVALDRARPAGDQPRLGAAGDPDLDARRRGGGARRGRIGRAGSARRFPTSRAEPADSLRP